MTMPLMKPRKKNPVLRTRQMNLPPWARGRTALAMTAAAAEGRFADLGRVHLLGIGGVGVSGVARILQEQGVAVSGSDAKDLPVMRELAEDGMTMLVVTHEMGFARNVADTVVFMDGGVVVEAGEAGQVIEDPQQHRTQEFLASIRR